MLAMLLILICSPVRVFVVVYSSVHPMSTSLSISSIDRIVEVSNKQPTRHVKSGFNGCVRRVR